MMSEKKIRINYLNTAININNNILSTIFNSSNYNNINSELLFAIVVIEKMNRGHVSNYILEKTLSTLLPSLLITKDASIGLCQIRLSAVRKVSSMSKKKIIRKLMCPQYNIEIMGKLISLYTVENLTRYESVKRILNLHITAKDEVQSNIYLNTYYDLVYWSMSQNYFSIIYSSNKNVSSFK